MRVLLTGAAGFIGSHLCDRLLAEGHSVVGLDNFVTGSPENIAHLAGHDRFLFIRHDVSNYIYIPGRVEAVMHFASPASPNPHSPFGYPNLPIQTLKAGALGTHNALGVARAQQARFLLASTSEIYGDPLEHPQRETYFGHVNPVGPRSMYDEAKRFAEAITMAYHGHHGVDTRIARIFNTYGPRMRLDDGRVVPNLVGQALRGEPLTVYGDGLQTRSFCYVDDLVDGILRLLLSDEHLPVNLGNPSEISIRDFAERIALLSGGRSSITYLADRRGEDDPQRRQPDISRARGILGWQPQVDLDRGLQATLASFAGRMGLR
ncbi:MAG TPA: UDP-glucuronic acid decarboxylase family protein [Anaerolineales bacterium]|nr:UDP-glucuronic acid decarboxylase family protein [Anaerolineales bacterium]